MSTEAPKFKTIARDERMSVVHPPSTNPTIVWVNQRQRLRETLGDLWGLRVGERVLFYCQADYSFPAANLKFYINDEIVRNEDVFTPTLNMTVFRLVIRLLRLFKFHSTRVSRRSHLSPQSWD